MTAAAKGRFPGSAAATDTATARSPWRRVPPVLDRAGVPVPLASVAITAHAAWATARDRAVWVRVGVTAATPVGTAWLALPPNDMEWAVVCAGAPGGGAVAAAAAPRLWGITVDRRVFLRVGITAARPAGLYWSLLNGTLAGREGCRRTN